MNLLYAYTTKKSLEIAQEFNNIQISKQTKIITGQ